MNKIINQYCPVERLESEQHIRFLCPFGAEGGTRIIAPKVVRPLEFKVPYFHLNVTAPNLLNLSNTYFKVDRFLWYCIVRGEEDVGVQCFVVSKALHNLIIGQILALPIKPKITRKEKLFRWCANLFGFHRVELVKDCLDSVIGYDFVVRMSFKRTATNKFPTYERSSFIAKSKPAGTPQQMALWQKQMSSMNLFVVENLASI